MDMTVKGEQGLSGPMSPATDLAGFMTPGSLFQLYACGLFVFLRYSVEN